MMNARFTEPEGLVWSSFANAAGARIRYAHLKSPRPWGRIVIVGGFREPAEKYFEATRFFTGLGLDVFLMDWRGQGGSDRYLSQDPMRAHARDFADHLDTLFRFVRLIGPGRPLLIAGHSMGGHLALRFLSMYPAFFDAAILTAPMLDIRTWPVPRLLARVLARLAVFCGRAESYVVGSGPWAAPGDAFEGNVKTHDPERFAVQESWFAKMPLLRIGGPTWGWLRAAFASISVLKTPLVLEKVRIPVLIGVAGDDRIVRSSAIIQAAGRMPKCKWVDIPDAWHEIWMEDDARRDLWIRAVENFVADRRGEIRA